MLLTSLALNFYSEWRNLEKSGKLWFRVVHLQGLHALTLDSKGRIAIPHRYRDVFRIHETESLIITIDLSGLCLWLYPVSHWEKITKTLQALPNLNRAIMRLQRLLIGHASEVEIDSQGRLLIPLVLRKCAKLSKNLVLMGQGKRFELWDAKVLEKERQTWLLDSSRLTHEIQEIIL